MTKRKKLTSREEKKRDEAQKAKLDLALARELTRKAVIQALKNGSRHCSHDEHMGLTLAENNHYVSFLQNLNRALANLASNSKKRDSGFAGFLPTNAMREVFRNMDVVKTSDFIKKPLVVIDLRLSVHDMRLPVYLAYLHPEYRRPN
jgi:hypothetical protein